VVKLFHTKQAHLAMSKNARIAAQSLPESEVLRNVAKSYSCY